MFHFAVPSAGASARCLAGALVALPLFCGAVLAQTGGTTGAGGAAPAAQGATSPAPAAKSDAATPPADPIVAKVDGEPIHLSDVQAAAADLPEGARSMPPQTLYPLLLNQMIGGRALVAEAKKTGMDKDPFVQRQAAMAAMRATEGALLQKEIGPMVTDEAVKARYEKDIASKPGAEEVHARHILVPDEATAKTIIAELKKGGDFVALSKKYSKDPGSAAQGGDLGFFKKDQMVPEFADAAFALKDNEVSPTPVKSQFGYHVIQVLGHRNEPAKTFEESRDELRQEMIQEAVQKVLARARAAATIEVFNLDGTPMRATDKATPPPAAR